MEFNQKQEQLLTFLDKNYVIKDGRFIRNYDDVHEWGKDIVEALASIFSFDHDFCVMNFKFWSELRRMSQAEWILAYESHILKTRWNVDMARDLQILHGVTSAEEQVISMLANELTREIDTDVLKELKIKTKTIDEFISVVRCVGYETMMIASPIGDKRRRKGFVSMNYNDIKNERKINTFWQDWLRTREQDKKT